MEETESGVQGRWMIRSQFVGDDGWTHRAVVEGPPTPYDASLVPVVPCDEAAVERATEAIFATDSMRAFDAESRDDLARWLARAALRAAGEDS